MILQLSHPSNLSAVLAIRNLHTSGAWDGVFCAYTGSCSQQGGDSRQPHPLCADLFESADCVMPNLSPCSVWITYSGSHMDPRFPEGELCSGKYRGYLRSYQPQPLNNYFDQNAWLERILGSEAAIAVSRKEVRAEASMVPTANRFLGPLPPIRWFRVWR